MVVRLLVGALALVVGPVAAGLGWEYVAWVALILGTGSLVAWFRCSARRVPPAAQLAASIIVCRYTISNVRTTILQIL